MASQMGAVVYRPRSHRLKIGQIRARILAVGSRQITLITWGLITWGVDETTLKDLAS